MQLCMKIVFACVHQSYIGYYDGMGVVAACRCADETCCYDVNILFMQLGMQVVFACVHQSYIGYYDGISMQVKHVVQIKHVFLGWFSLSQGPEQGNFKAVLGLFCPFCHVLGVVQAKKGLFVCFGVGFARFALVLGVVQA